MLEILPSGADVLAVRIEGAMADDELQALSGRLETLLSENAKTHVYVEGSRFGMIEPAALAHYLPHAIKMLQQRERFGRIAIVTNQRLVRLLTKLESALLPGISYQTFKLEERECARAWIDGRQVLPHGATVKMIETDRPDVLGFELNGKVSAIEMAAVADYFKSTLAHGRPTRLLGRIKQIAGAELFAFADADYIAMKLGMVRSLERYAIVGGPTWLRATVQSLALVMKIQLRHFAEDEEAAAWEWLGAQPTREIRLVQ